MSVRKWTLPLTLAGLGGVGAVLFTGRGRRLLQKASWRLEPKPVTPPQPAWDHSLREELDHIQQEVRELERNLGTPAAG